MVLTERQKEDLHKAILDYLKTSGFSVSAQAFEREATVVGAESAKGQLEQKWTSVVRLQKKVMDLEARIQQVQEDTGSVRKMMGGAKNGVDPEMPRAPEVFTLTGHRDNITAVKFHPVFSVAVSSSLDASIRIWDYDSGQFERSLKGHTNAVNGIAFDKSGGLLASCSSDMTVKLWAFQTFECKKTLQGHEHSVSDVAFLPSGDFLASASRDKTIKIWEIASGFCVKTLEGHEEWVRSIIVSEDGANLVSCSQDKTIRVWDISRAEFTAVLREHDHYVECIALSPASLTELETPEGVIFKGRPGPGNFLASGSRDRTIIIWEMSTAMKIMMLVGHDNWVRALQFHPNGKYLLSVSDDKSIRIWDFKQGRAVKVLSDAHKHFVTCMDLHPKSLCLITGSVDNSIKVWNSR